MGSALQGLRENIIWMYVAGFIPVVRNVSVRRNVLRIGEDLSPLPLLPLLHNTPVSYHSPQQPFLRVLILHCDKGCPIHKLWVDISNPWLWNQGSSLIADVHRPQTTHKGKNIATFHLCNKKFTLTSFIGKNRAQVLRTASLLVKKKIMMNWGGETNKRGFK